MGDGGIGDETFPNQPSEVERRNPFKTLASILGEKYSNALGHFIRGEKYIASENYSEVKRINALRTPAQYSNARRQFIAEDPLHGPVLAAKDEAEWCSRNGFVYGAFAGMLALGIAETKGCIIPRINPRRLVIVSLGLGCLLFAIGPAGRVGEIVWSKYGRRKFQVDTLDTVTAEDKFQEWFVQNETLILTGNEKFLKWLEKTRLFPQAKFQELYKKA